MSVKQQWGKVNEVIWYVSQTPEFGLSHALSDVIKRFISSWFQKWFKVLQFCKQLIKGEYCVNHSVVLIETMALPRKFTANSARSRPAASLLHRTPWTNTTVLIAHSKFTKSAFWFDKLISSYPHSVKPVKGLSQYSHGNQLNVIIICSFKWVIIY